MLNNATIINAFDYWRKFIIKNNKWYSSISSICKHLVTRMDDLNNLLVVKSTGDEEIVICHIHGVVKQNDDLFLLDDQCGQNRVSFLLGNVEYIVTNTNNNEYSLKVQNVDVCTRVNYEVLITELNNRIRNIF